MRVGREEVEVQREGGGACMRMLAGEEGRWRGSATARGADGVRLEIFLLRPGEGLELATSVVLRFLERSFWGSFCDAGDFGGFCSCLSIFGSTFTKEREHQYGSRTEGRDWTYQEYLYCPSLNRTCRSSSA